MSPKEPRKGGVHFGHKTEMRGQGGVNRSLWHWSEKGSIHILATSHVPNYDDYCRGGYRAVLGTTRNAAGGDLNAGGYTHRKGGPPIRVSN